MLSRYVATAILLCSELNSKSYLLRGGTEIPSNSDLNNYKTPGNYFVSSNSVANTLTNSPFTHAHTLKVEYGQGTGYPVQIGRRLNDGCIAYRLYNTVSSSWSNWVYFSDDDTAFRDVFIKTQQNNVDYNELAPGFHYCGTGCTNAPGSYCRVLCLYSYPAPGVNSVQIAFGVIDGNIYKRVYLTGNWTPWYKFAGTIISS